MREYRERNTILRRAGFGSYAAYLKSDLWNSIRHRVLAKNNGCCLRCGRPAVNVHHTQYTLAALRGKRIGSLVPLCRPCHRSGEFGPDGSKVTLSQANVRLGLLPQKCATPETLEERRRRLLPNLYAKNIKRKAARVAKRESRKLTPGYCPACGGKLRDGLCHPCHHPRKRQRSTP
jgi:hypothetical protein